MNDSTRQAAGWTVPAAVYIGLMAAGMALMHFGFGLRYDQPEMVRIIGPVEVVLTLWTLHAVRRLGGWRAAGMGALRWRALAWLLPLAVPLALGLASLAREAARPGLAPGRGELLAMVAATVGLVGFSEELMFRGVLLRAAWRRTGLFRAMLASATGFSALHAVNLLGGSPLPAVAVQLLSTFLFGLCFAPLAVRLGSLWPLVLFHWGWDLMLLGHAALGVAVPAVALLSAPLMIAVGAALWWSLHRQRGLDEAGWTRATAG